MKEAAGLRLLRKQRRMATRDLLSLFPDRLACPPRRRQNGTLLLFSNCRLRSAVCFLKMQLDFCLFRSNMTRPCQVPAQEEDVLQAMEVGFVSHTGFPLTVAGWLYFPSGMLMLNAFCT